MPPMATATKAVWAKRSGIRELEDRAAPERRLWTAWRQTAVPLMVVLVDSVVR
jgi:hypothetical protein